MSQNARLHLFSNVMELHAITFCWIVDQKVSEIWSLKSFIEQLTGFMVVSNLSLLICLGKTF